MWLHTLDRHWLEFAANPLLARLAMTILDSDWPIIIFTNFICNPYHGDHYVDEDELCPMAPENGTTAYHRDCTAHVVSNEKPVTLAMMYIRNGEDKADAVKRVSDRVKAYSFETDLLFADGGFYNEVSFAVLMRSLQQSSTSPRRVSG